MIEPPPLIKIGAVIEDEVIFARSCDEYLGCKFLRCEISYQDGAKLYDCEFIDSTIHINGYNDV